jgi:hypothetical protein
MPYADPEQQKEYSRRYRQRKRAENLQLVRYDETQRKRRQRPEPKRAGSTKSLSPKRELPTSDEHVAWAAETAGWGGTGSRRSRAGGSDNSGGGGSLPLASELFAVDWTQDYDDDDSDIPSEFFFPYYSITLDDHGRANQTKEAANAPRRPSPRGRRSQPGPSRQVVLT